MKGKRILLFGVCAGMELCYLYAGANFVTTSVFHQVFPFPEAVGSFLLALLLTFFSEGRGWRVISVLALMSLGFIPALLRMVNVFYSWSDSFLSQPWLTQSFDNPSSAVEYSIFVLVIIWILVFWAGGVGLARQPRDYSTICSHFDRGLFAFFALFLTKFYLHVIQGIKLDEGTSSFLLIPFLTFSLLAIGLVRNQSAAQKDFLPGYQTIGVVLGFIVVTLMVGVGLAFFSLPYLTLAAENGYGILKLVSEPLALFLFMVTNWLFGTDFEAPGEVPAAKVETPSASTLWSFPGWMELLGRILVVGVEVLVGLVLLAIVGGLLYSVFRWLFSRTSLDQDKPSPRDLFSSFAAQLRELVLFFWHKLVRAAAGSRKAVSLYVALRTWGRHSGLTHFLDETPNEYSLRLRRRFPTLGREIELITEAFNWEVYGEIVLNNQQLSAARSAWRRLASPVHWPMRLKAWFLRTYSGATQYYTLE